MDQLQCVWILAPLCCLLAIEIQGLLCRNFLHFSSYFWTLLFWGPEGLGNSDTSELGLSVLNLYMFSQDVLTKMPNVHTTFLLCGHLANPR